ncbi:MAG: FAD-dependent oxidoreductase [Desulfomonilia bacterium]
MQTLFTPLRINSLELKNRIIMPCLDSTFTGDGGVVTSRLIEYFLRRARGGVSLVLIGPASFESLGIGYRTDYRLDRDDILEGLSGLVRKIHECGIPMGIQMYHAGRQADTDITGGDMVAPSAIADPVRKITPRALSVPQIEQIVHRFGVHALRAKEAGFDVIELHCSHGYLLAEFLSNHANARTDRYGGSVENRARLPMEIIREVRRNVGPEFPILVRLAGDEHVKGGLSTDETPEIAHLLEEAGADAINVSAGTYQSAEWIVPPAFLPRGCNVEAAAAIKKAVNIPVIVAGRINTPELADALITEGRVDAVAMGRPLVADPDLPNKARQGRSDEIRHCIGCDLCVDKLFKGETLVCTVNPEVGHESEFSLHKAEHPKRVMVVGGGPAGMEAARVAALRGHSVSLYDRGEVLGGQLIAASRAPYKEEIVNIIEYYTRVLTRCGVDVHLAHEVTAETVNQVNPDAVLIATGSVPIVPDIPGTDLPHVVQARDVLMGTSDVSGDVAVIGGGSVGCEVSLFLVERGCRVKVFEQLPYVAYGIPRLFGKMMKSRMRDVGVAILTGSQVLRITPEGVVSTGPDNVETTHRAQYVVIAAGSEPVSRIAQEIEGRVQEIHLIGDAAEPRRAAEAISEGARAGRML